MFPLPIIPVPRLTVLSQQDDHENQTRLGRVFSRYRTGVSASCQPPITACWRRNQRVVILHAAYLNRRAGTVQKVQPVGLSSIFICPGFSDFGSYVAVSQNDVS